MHDDLRGDGPKVESGMFTGDPPQELRHREWARCVRDALAPLALPGGYPNLLAGDRQRAGEAFGPNRRRLLNAKRHYDPDHVFCSAIPLPIDAP